MTGSGVIRRSHRQGEAGYGFASNPSLGCRKIQSVAPFAFGRRKCSSSRGMISTKLQGRVR